MLITLTFTALAVMLSVLVHYEAFLRLSVLMKHMHIFPRFRIVFGAIGALVAHVVGLPPLFVRGLGSDVYRL